jgi:hypothetical protein
VGSNTVVLGCGALSLAPEGVTGFGRFGLSLRAIGSRCSRSSVGLDSFGLLGVLSGTMARPIRSTFRAAVSFGKLGVVTVVEYLIRSFATAGAASIAAAHAAPSSVSVCFVMISP